MRLRKRFRFRQTKLSLLLLVLLATGYFIFIKGVSFFSAFSTSDTVAPRGLSRNLVSTLPEPHTEHLWTYTPRRTLYIRPPVLNRSLASDDAFLGAKNISKREILKKGILKGKWKRIPDILTFTDLVNIDDTFWKLPINPAVFNLYPQAVNLKKLVQLVKQDHISPIEPIFNQSLRYLQIPKNICDRSLKPRRLHSIVIIVKSGIYNFRNRQLLRDAYRGRINDENSEIVMVFSVGLPRKSGGRVFQRDGFVITLPGRAGDAVEYYQSRYLEVLTNLKLEDEVNHDLLIGDYEDTYYNLTLKMMHSFQWASSSCASQKPTFVFIDDDFAFNVDKLRHVIGNRTESTKGQMAIGVVRRKSPTVRHGRTPAYEKWSLSKREVPWPVLAPHTSGQFYVFGYEIVKEIAAAMYFTAPLPLDDVWLGLIVTKLSINYELLPGLYHSFNPKLHHREDALFAPFEVLFPIQHDRFGYV